jgi:hypothetical protein
MRIGYHLVMLLFTVASFSTVADAQDIRGIWRTIDASDEEGRRQGGIVFRTNGTGEFLSPTFFVDGPKGEEWTKLIETATKGSSNMMFTYSIEAAIVSIEVTHFGGMPVSNSNIIKWKAEMSGRELKLSAQDGSGKWITLNKI